MRLLHTADWHLGRTIRGRSRAPEFAAMLAEVCGIAIEEGVDVVVVAGDIWDSMTPPPEADRLLYSALRRLIEAKVDVVLVAGNHDNARRLEALGQLAGLLGVRTQATVKRWDAGGTITIERGGETLRLAAVPWVPDGRVLNAQEIIGTTEESLQTYADRVAEIYRQSAQAFTDETINVFAAHVFVDESLVALVDGSERRVHIGQTYAVKPAAVPAYAQYVALGHVHQPQEIEAPNHAATYSGSLLQLDFGERNQDKVVRLVDAAPGRPARHRPVALTSGRRLVEARGSFEEIVAQGGREGDAFIRAVLRLDGPEPGIAPRLREALPNCVEVRVEHALKADETPPAALATMTPQDLFVRYFKETHSGAAPTPEILAVFREVLEAATAEVS
jgi:exonuclease SbcD